MMKTIEAVTARDDLNYLLLRIAEQRYGVQPERMSPTQRAEAERIAARQADIQRRVLASNEAIGVVVPDTEVNTALDQIRARYGGEDEFFRELTSNGLTLEQMHCALQREMKVDAVLARVSARAPAVDETEARLYYYLHPQKFEQPETRVARHILITINPTFPENKRDVALQRCEEIARRLQRKPDRFAEQAMKHSECPTALEGGLLGRIKRGTLYPELENSLFAMKEGTVSDVIESPIGFHVLYCEKIHPEGLAPLKQVLPKLCEQLNAREANREQKRWIESLFANKSTDCEATLDG
ncbi:MAG: nitrogen fixation protein NifM [Spongiibacteraceae bacterium]